MRGWATLRDLLKISINYNFTIFQFSRHTSYTNIICISNVRTQKGHSSWARRQWRCTFYLRDFISLFQPLEVSIEFYLLCSAIILKFFQRLTAPPFLKHFQKWAFFGKIVLLGVHKFYLYSELERIRKGLPSYGRFLLIFLMFKSPLHNNRCLRLNSKTGSSHLWKIVIGEYEKAFQKEDFDLVEICFSLQPGPCILCDNDWQCLESVFKEYSIGS